MTATPFYAAQVSLFKTHTQFVSRGASLARGALAVCTTAGFASPASPAGDERAARVPRRFAPKSLHLVLSLRKRHGAYGTCRCTRAPAGAPGTCRCSGHLRVPAPPGACGHAGAAAGGPHWPSYHALISLSELITLRFAFSLHLYLIVAVQVVDSSSDDHNFYRQSCTLQ